MASVINAGHIVINVYLTEGGYLVTFKNEYIVNAKDDWVDQVAISP